jgi:hypothetical protein
MKLLYDFIKKFTIGMFLPPMMSIVYVLIKAIKALTGNKTNN